MTEPASGWPSRVAVVGAGTMGVGISQVFAASGIPTVLVDATAELSEAGAGALARAPPPARSRRKRRAGR